MHVTEPALARAPAPEERLVTGPFLAVAAVTTLFFVYVGIQIPLIPRLIEDHLGGNELDIGLNLAAFSLSAIAIRPLLATFGDRYGRRMMMIVGSMLAGIGAMFAAYAENRWLLLPIRAVCGIGEGAVFVGAATMISDIAPAHRRAEAASYFSLAVFGGIGVGPIIGESLANGDHFGRGLLGAATCAFGAAVFALIIPHGKRAHVRPVDVDVDVVEPADVAVAPEQASAALSGARPHRFHRAAIKPGVVLAFGLAGFATFNAFIPDHATDVGLASSKWVFATYSVVCFIVRLAGAKVPERLGLLKSAVMALVFIAAGLGVLAGVATPTGLYAAAVLIGFGMSFLYPSLMALTVNGSPDRERTRVLSTFTMFFEVGNATGGLLFGWVAELTTKRGGFLAGSISAAIGVLVLWRVLLPAIRLRPISASELRMSAAH